MTDMPAPPSTRPLALAVLLALAASCTNGPDPSDMSGAAGASEPASTGGPTTDDPASTGAPDPTDATTTTTSSTTTSSSPGTTTDDPTITTGTTDDPATSTTGDPPPENSRIVGYYTAWSVYARDFHVAEIPADRLTHINYGFANLTADGTCVLGDAFADAEKAYEGDAADLPFKGNFHQLQLLKQKHPHLRVLVSVGGWTWSGNFSAAAATAEGRAKLAASCVEFMRTYDLDGLDIDWEYPVSGGLPDNGYSPADKQNYTLLLAELRARLDAAGAEDGADYLLTIAAPAGPNVLVNLELDKIHAHLDWINLMAYDLAGPWAPNTGLQAALYAPADDPDPQNAGLSVDAAATAYLAAGVPADKLVIGVPFYGRSFKGTAGLFEPHGGAGPGTWEAGVLDYHDLVANYVPKYTRTWHEGAAVPWLYDPATQLLITYDDPESIARKADYIRDHDLGGAMIWDLSSDTADGALVNALAGTLLP